MRVWKQSIAGLLTAAILLPVPALAISSSSKVSARAISPRQLTQPSGTATAEDLVFDQTEERREFVAFSRALRSQFRRSGPLTRASVSNVIRNVAVDLRAHWALETRTRTISSPFNFPAF